MSAAPVRLAQTADPSAVRDELLDRSLRSGWVLVYLNILIALFLGTIQLTSGYDPVTKLSELLLRLFSSSIASLIPLVTILRKPGPDATERLLMAQEVLVLFASGIAVTMALNEGDYRDNATSLIGLATFALITAVLVPRVFAATWFGRGALFLPVIGYVAWSQPPLWGVLIALCLFAYLVSLGVAITIYRQNLTQADISCSLAIAHARLEDAFEYEQRTRAEMKEEATLHERFLHAITHDLNQPLGALRFHLRRLQRRENSPAVSKFSETAEACLLSSEAIIESVAGSAWLRRDIPEAGLHSVALHPLFEAVQTQMLGRADHYGVAIRIAPTSLAVSADPAYLERVLRNLVQNALQFASARVLIGARPHGDQVRIWVADDGPGVPEAQRDKIFERFSQVKDAKRRESGNVGLGLAIVAELSAKMGGGAGIADGDGGRFYVQLRRAEATATLPAPSIALVVDDDPADPEQMAAALTSAGWRVEAPDEVSRDMLTARVGFDLYVLDGSLAPDLTAIDLLQATDWRDAARTIVASKEVTPDFVKQLRAKGVWFQQKPFSTAGLR